VCALTCGAAALVLYAQGFFALLLGCQAGALQCAAAAVGEPVAAADLVVALARADAQLVLLVLVAPDALQSGAAAARCCAAATTHVALRSGAHRAAAAGVQQGAGGTALPRERRALGRVTRAAAWTCQDPDREHRARQQERQKEDERRHGGLRRSTRCWSELGPGSTETRSPDWAFSGC